MTQAVRLSSTALGVHRCCLIFDFGDSAKWYVPRCLLPVIQPTSLLGLQPFLRTQKIRRPDPGRTLPEHRSLNDSSWKVISFTTSIDCDRSSGSAASSVRPTHRRKLFRDNSLQTQTNYRSALPVEVGFPPLRRTTSALAMTASSMPESCIWRIVLSIS